MRSLRIYLVVVSVLLLIAIGFGVYVWYRIQTLELEPQEVLPEDTLRQQILEEARTKQNE